ncbi:MAG: DNA double-strand break repair nuclease NurA [Candidatus Aenigmarchaeota archaeon]|nr:DNA double-strand break repair nuclease NurA [Candidatus Aenigmarchaeota archaeon]
MHELLSKLPEIAEKIRTLETNREKLGHFLREVSEKVELSGDVLEPNLIYTATPDLLDGKKVIAIDGGLSQHSYHGIDLILTRAVAVVFDYLGGKLDKVDYHPHSIVTPTLTIISDPYSEEEFFLSSSLERERGEIELAAECFSKFPPQLLLLDGSVVPHGKDKPAKTSAAWERYESVLRSFISLYKSSSGSLLAGCVEDSRGRSFCEIVSSSILSALNNPKAEELRRILASTRDTNLLYYTLRKGERTAVFRYSKNPSDHPILSDLQPYGEKIFSFYLKTAEFDRPVRIDFFSLGNPIETANKIASIVLSLSPHNSYGFPAPLIEADFRAKLQENDVNSLHDQLVDRVGITPSLMKLRREQRPF